MGHSFMKPAARKAANKKSPKIPTRNANPTGKAGKGRPESVRTSQRFNRAALYRAKGEKII